MTDADSAKIFIDVQKAVVDYVKHVTTLSTGSIVVMVSLLSNVLKDAEYVEIVAAALAMFIAATICLTLTLLGVVSSMRTPAKVAGGTRSFTTMTFLGGLAGFVVGTVLLAVFSIANLL